MRILLIACQFIEKRSPRALRWRYLVRELARHGHDVHVLTPGLKGGGDKVDVPCRVHTAFPGPLAWILLRRRRGKHSSSNAKQSHPTLVRHSATRLNRKGRIVHVVRGLMAKLFFPGDDAEWLPWAKRRLVQLLEEYKPAIVVSSHEPASTLLLGLEAKRRGFAWIADLGDPVCAEYTLRRWRGKALRLEEMCMHAADCVIVPNRDAKAFYEARHGVPSSKFHVLPQGYDDRAPTFELSGSSIKTGAVLRLVYAGRIYPFRDPRPLLQAVSMCADDVRLPMILADPPERGLYRFLEGVAGVEFIQAISHEEVRRAQQHADVLVSIGNAGMPAQVPAKVFEFMGILRPILHLYPASESMDLPARLIQSRQRGWCVPNAVGPVQTKLARLAQLAREGRLSDGLNLAPIREYAFSCQGEKLSSLLVRVAGGGES